jgi:hypothetical protein
MERSSSNWVTKVKINRKSVGCLVECGLISENNGLVAGANVAKHDLECNGFHLKYFDLKNLQTFKVTKLKIIILK